jgi:hypothetical protein
MGDNNNLVCGLGLPRLISVFGTGRLSRPKEDACRQASDRRFANL